ncbi:MAG: OsmC family protein, partial [Betaproteobacteria bacterium]|nr:OsmC family protein [Betaproteobacteria bacterium]
MASTSTETIEGSGFPLAFKAKRGKARPGVVAAGQGRDVFKVEARQLAGHQKEAIVTEGEAGSAWRVTSDEGKHLKGADVAPFPLGVFNAGLHADLINRLLAGARERELPLSSLEIDLKNGYSMTGAFFRGDGKGYAEPAAIKVKIASTAEPSQIARLVRDAVSASPALAAMRLPLENTFALYVNGRRRTVTTMKNSDAPDAADPFRTYSKPPQPIAGTDDLPDLIRKTGQQMAGTAAIAPAGAQAGGRIVREVSGVSRLLDPAGVTETDTWLEMPGMSHFALKTDERATGDQAPSGLALLSAGIAFCYMTQLSRYIEHMKFKIRAVRLVQYSPYAVTGSAKDASWRGGVEPVDTHLFLNGEESDETHERLMNIAATTCYLHATLVSQLAPVVSVELSGSPLAV